MIVTPAGDVWVEVLDLFRGKARLGVSAPLAIRVDREEVSLARNGSQGGEPRREDGG